ncbi:hypothetical protein V4C53_38890 [Paraburkholderia azotifigens]|uniref:hypothetical protein n=1 Tax=Paraburkholderia azotifigens TaxID=2057004 RepID=UPI00317A9866
MANDENLAVEGFLNNNYILKGKVSGIFAEESSTTFCLVAIEPDNPCEECNKDLPYRFYHIIRNAALGKLAQNAMLAGMPVVLYGKNTNEKDGANTVAAIEISFGQNKWWSNP